MSFRTGFCFLFFPMKIRAWHALGFGILIFPILCWISGFLGYYVSNLIGWSQGTHVGDYGTRGVLLIFCGPYFGVVSALVITFWNQKNGALARILSFVGGMAGLTALLFFASDFRNWHWLALDFGFFILPACWSVLLIFAAIFARNRSQFANFSRPKPATNSDRRTCEKGARARKFFPFQAPKADFPSHKGAASLPEFPNRRPAKHPVFEG